MTESIDRNVQMMTIDGLRLPKHRKLRPRRAIPGLDGAYSVTQDGRVYSAEHDEVWDADQWPRIWLPCGDRLAVVDVMASVATAWLDEEQRAVIRGRLSPGSQHGDATVRRLVQEFGVSKHAVALVANKPDSEIIPARFEIEEVGGDLQRLEKAQPTDYLTFLQEYSRPPLRGGNTSALHVHTMIIEGQKYSFFARGARQWVYKGDTVSFSYRVTEKGYRNVLRGTIVTQDKAGRPVVRGDRRAKPVLRSTPAKMPGSRREQRD